MAAEIRTEQGEDDRRRSTATRIVVAGFVVLAVIAAVVFVSARGDDAEVATEDPTLAGASAATMDAGSARVLLTSEDGSFRMEGLMSFGTDGRGRFDYVGSEDPVATLIALPDATYAEFEGHWVKFTNEEFAEGSGYRLGTDRNEFLAIVQLFVESLEHAAPASVRTTGTDVLRGEDVTVVTATLDLREAIRASSVEFDPSEVGGSLSGFGSDLTVMLDEQGRARRVQLWGGDEDLAIELWDFGVEVDVEAPAEYDESDALDEPGESDDVYVEYGDIDGVDVDVAAVYCPLTQDFLPMLDATAPSSDAADWGSAAETMALIADEAPIETRTWTGVLASAYEGIEQALGAGATLDEVMADGVETDHGLLDWRSIRDAERGFVEVTDLLCD